MSLDGLLVVDKPVGPTSHDVVSRVRRILRERRIGHTGTLDPLASGVLLLVVGRATRLAQFLNADAKRYDATIRLGFATDTCDALGRPTTSTYVGAMPTRERIEEALQAFRGTFAQQPPAFSAKKIDGRRSYRLARAHQRTVALPFLPILPCRRSCPARRSCPSCPRPSRPCVGDRQPPRRAGRRRRSRAGGDLLFEWFLRPVAGARSRYGTWRRRSSRHAATERGERTDAQRFSAAVGHRRAIRR